MPKRRNPDWETIFHFMGPEHGIWLEETARLLGLEHPYGWMVVPALREISIDVAVVNCAKGWMEQGLSEKDATIKANEAFGIEDDPEDGQSPADNFLHKVRTWRRTEKQLPPPPAWLLEYFPATYKEVPDEYTI